VAVRVPGADRAPTSTWELVVSTLRTVVELVELVTESHQPHPDYHSPVQDCPTVRPPVILASPPTLALLSTLKTKFVYFPLEVAEHTHHPCHKLRLLPVYSLTIYMYRPCPVIRCTPSPPDDPLPVPTVPILTGSAGLLTSTL